MNYQMSNSKLTPPSAPMVRPLTWISASALGGGLVFGTAMALLWRDLPGLPAPDGSLGTHLAYCAKSAIHMLLPSFQAAPAAEYAEHLAALSERGELWAIVWRVALCAALATAPSFALAGTYLKPRDALMHTRGGRRYSGREAVKRLNNLLALKVRRRPDHFLAPLVQYPADLWSRHALVVGGVGAGKSQVVLPLVAQIIARNERLIAYDAKGELTTAFPSPILIAPCDERSHAWDIAKDLRNLGDIRGFAEALVPEGHDPFWANAARQILVGYLLYLKDSLGTLWGWQELADMLRTPVHALLPLMERYNPEAARAVEKPNITTQGILMNLSAYCSAIFDLASAWGAMPASRRVSFAEWALAEPKHRQVIIQGHGSFPQLTQAITKGILGVVAGLVNSPELPDSLDRKLWIIADEAAQMGKAPLRAICEVGRSKGARVLLAIQDFAQLEAIHGRESVRALISMCGTLIVGAMGPGETAETLCKALGASEAERLNTSVSSGAGGAAASSTTVSYAREDVAIYKPSELATRLGVNRDGTAVVLAVATGGDAYELEWKIHAWGRLRVGFVPASWITGACLGAPLLPLRSSDAKAEPVAPLALSAPRLPRVANLEARARDQAQAFAFAGLVAIDPKRSGQDSEPRAPEPSQGAGTHP